MSEKMTKRQQQALNTKKQIFNSAVKLFNIKGYENVTIRDICKEANVSLGLFYNYFSSREQIILEEFATASEIYEDFYKQLPPGINSVNKIISFIEIVIDYSLQVGKERMKPAYYSMIGPGKKEYTFFADENRALFKIIQALIEDAQKENLLSINYSSKDIALKIATCLYGFHYMWQIDDNFDLKKQGIEISRALLDGLRKNQEASNDTTG